jgi:uncharacterized membrane protein YhiD involved in acid resistance
MTLRVFATLAGLLLAAPAHAYIGPGVGAGAIAVVLGVIGSIFIAIVAILWFPFKRMLKKRKASAAASTKAEQGPDDPNGA